jgi:hypothetical protein
MKTRGKSEWEATQNRTYGPRETSDRASEKHSPISKDCACSCPKQAACDHSRKFRITPRCAERLYGFGSNVGVPIRLSVVDTRGCFRALGKPFRKVLTPSSITPIPMRVASGIPSNPPFIAETTKTGPSKINTNPISQAPIRCTREGFDEPFHRNSSMLRELRSGSILITYHIG